MTVEQDRKNLSCFVVGPIGDRLDAPGTAARLRYENATQMWETVFEPACSSVGLIPVRADKIAESGEIPEQIFTYLRDADVVIADLTGGNANVMYELGLRHTRDKITIQIGEHEQLPFDVNTIRTIKFRRTEAGLIDARNSLSEALQVALAGGGKPVTATRVWNEVAPLGAADFAKGAELSSVSDDPFDQSPEEPGVVDLLAIGELAIERMTEIMGEFSTAMESMATLASELSPEIESSPSFASRLTMIRKYADGLKGPAVLIDETSEEFLMRVNEVDAMVMIVLELASQEPEPEIWEFLRAIHGLREGANEASVSFTEVLQATRDLGKLSSQLTPVSKSMSRSINRMLRANDIVAGWAVAIDELPDSAGHLAEDAGRREA